MEKNGGGEICAYFFQNWGNFPVSITVFLMEAYKQFNADKFSDAQ